MLPHAEALRIHPPLLMVMRYAKQPFTVTTSKGQSYTIPAVSLPTLLPTPTPPSTGLSLRHRRLCHRFPIPLPNRTQCNTDNDEQA